MCAEQLLLCYSIVSNSYLQKNFVALKLTNYNFEQKIGNKNKLALTHIGLELLKNNSKEKMKEVVFYDEDDN